MERSATHEWRVDATNNTHECWVGDVIRFDVEEDDGDGNVRIYDMKKSIGWSLKATSVDAAKQWCERQLTPSL